MEPKTNAQAALDAATTLYAGKAINSAFTNGYVLEVADSFLEWLNEHS